MGDTSSVARVAINGRTGRRSNPRPDRTVTPRASETVDQHPGQKTRTDRGTIIIICDVTLAISTRYKINAHAAMDVPPGHLHRSCPTPKDPGIPSASATPAPFPAGRTPDHVLDARARRKTQARRLLQADVLREAHGRRPPPRLQRYGAGAENRVRKVHAERAASISEAGARYLSASGVLGGGGGTVGEEVPQTLSPPVRLHANHSPTSPVVLGPQGRSMLRSG